MKKIIFLLLFGVSLFADDLVPDHKNFQRNLRPDFSVQQSAEREGNLHQVVESEREAGQKKMGQIPKNFCGRVLEPFTIGTTSGYAPFVSLNAQGKYEGFDIDLAEMLAKKLSRKLVIKDCGSMPGLMLALKQRKVDVLIWGLSITEDRMKNMEMIYYQGEKEAKIPLLFWNRVPEDIALLEDLAKGAKKTICVESGSFQEAVLKTVPGIVLKYVDKIDDAILDVKYGKSLAGTLDASVLPRFKARYPEIKVLELPIPKDKQSLGNGICISKDRSELAAQVKQAVKELAAEGKIAELEKKWNLVE